MVQALWQEGLSFVERLTMKDSLLLAIGGLIRKEINAGELLGRIVDTMAAELGADRGTIYLLDEGREELVSVAAHLPEISEIRVPLSEGVAGYVARTRSVVNIPFCDDDLRFWREVDRATGYETRTMLAGPLLDRRGRLIGVVQFLNKLEGMFTDEDQQTLAALSEQAAALLEETTLGWRSAETGLDKGNTKSERAAGRPRQGAVVLGEGFNQIVGHGEAMRAVFHALRRVAPLEATVLLRGESGTGKGVVARALHHNSGRRAGPFVQVDCTTIPEGLMESELFGHEKGAFTGADVRRQGKVEAARGGTLFLDEIGDLPASLQGKLLTLLQDHTYCPVGSSRRVDADIRIVTATNRDLEELVSRGLFREDLYYRLRVVQILLPTLRVRGREDLVELIHLFVARFSRRHGRPTLTVSREALEVLLSYPWPGNVRELENCLEAAVIFADEAITPEVLSMPRIGHQGLYGSGGTARSVASLDVSDQPSLRSLEARYIKHLLDVHQGNRSACARALDIGRNTLLRKMKDYGLE
jgi:Nif-specific regulatory protein